MVTEDENSKIKLHFVERIIYNKLARVCVCVGGVNETAVVVVSRNV